MLWICHLSHLCLISVYDRVTWVCGGNLSVHGCLLGACLILEICVLQCNLLLTDNLKVCYEFMIAIIWNIGSWVTQN